MVRPDAGEADDDFRDGLAAAFDFPVVLHPEHDDTDALGRAVQFDQPRGQLPTRHFEHAIWFLSRSNGEIPEVARVEARQETRVERRLPSIRPQIREVGSTELRGLLPNSITRAEGSQWAAVGRELSVMRMLNAREMAVEAGHGSKSFRRRLYIERYIPAGGSIWYPDLVRMHEIPELARSLWKRNVMSLKPWWIICGTVGFSIVLSGCLKVEGTTTVLEDGQIIDHVVLQPKMSMLASIAAFHSAIMNLPEKSSGKSYSKKRTFLAETRAELSSVTNACKLAEAIFDKQAYVRQGVPYSTVPESINFEYSGIRGNGCSIQIGPYDPRTLPFEFAEDVMGIRVEPLTGVYSPYRVSTIGVSLPAIENHPRLDASCAAEEKPELCHEEMKIAISVLRYIDEEASGKLRNVLANPGMLVGLAELILSIIKSSTITWIIPDNAAVGMLRGPGIYTYGQGWRWRGSLLEATSTLPGLRFEVRPRRAVAQ